MAFTLAPAGFTLSADVEVAAPVAVAGVPQLTPRLLTGTRAVVIAASLVRRWAAGFAVSGQE